MTNKTRTLQAVYEDGLTRLLAKDIQDEIDWQILNEMGVGRDWTEIKYSSDASRASQKEVKEWCDDKFTGGFFAFSDRIMIAGEEDIVKFMLRWS